MAVTNRITRAQFCQLDDGFAQLNSILARMSLSDETLEEFRIFCDPKTALEFFEYPKDTYKKIKIIIVNDYPTRMCNVIRSSEYTESKAA